MLINTVTPSKLPRLPSEYQEVEWIEPNWQWPYIDTWLAVSNQLAFDFNITPNLSYVSENSILGNNWSATALFFLFYNWWYILNNWWTSYNNWPTASTNKTRITVDKNWFSIDGTSYSCVSGNNYWSWNIWIYAVNNNYGDTRRWVFKLYNMEISQDWTLVRNMIPCYRKSDNVIGMYDLANDIFYTNQWTWTFTKWPDVN